jgi:HlyD family secretion protein
MDRPVDPSLNRRRKMRTITLWTTALVAGLALVILTVGLLRPSIRRDRIRTATVVRGEATATLDASGLVVPEFEHVLTAPLATRVARILMTPGAQIAPDEPIVQLDDTDARLNLAKLEEQISLEENASRLTEIELARTRDDLTAQRDIKALELKSLQFEANRNKQSFEQGLITEDALRKSEADAERGQIELTHLGASLINAEQDLAARLEGLALEIAILEKDRNRARARLERTAVASSRPGIVTWVIESEGLTVSEGDPVARVADLNTYRVDATLSDVLAHRLVVGLPATIRTGDTRLPGFVRKVLPTVRNGIVTFEVALQEQSHSVLRPNLRVDVHVVTERRTGTLCLKRAPVLNVDGQDAVFVIRGDKAVRTTVTLGISNFELYEVVDGLAEGDEVIISDMSDFRNSEEVKLR